MSSKNNKLKGTKLGIYKHNKRWMKVSKFLRIAISSEF